MLTLNLSPVNMKRVRAETDSSGSCTSSNMRVKSFQRWKKTDYQTMTWLECTAVPPGNKLVDKLKCKVYTKLVHG